MKFKFTILALIAFSLQAYSQSKNVLSVVYGTSNSSVNIHGVVGDFGYETKRANVFGLNYTRNISRPFSIITGVTFSHDDVQESSIVGGIGTIYHYDEIKMISIPVIAKLSFLKYLYTDAGFTADFQTNYTSNSVAPNQSGIGFESGLGAQYTYKSLTVFVNPYFQYHALAKFNAGQNFELANAGYKFGIGFGF